MQGRRSCVHNRGLAGALTSELGKAYCDRPPWVLYCYREFPVAIEITRPVSQQRI